MKVKLLTPEARVPERVNAYAAGYDLFAPTDFQVNPGRNLLKLGFCIELDPNTEGQIRPRSGFSAKGMEGTSLDKPDEIKRFDADIHIGTIDEDYRGEMGVTITSFEQKPFIIKAHTKIAQMVISHYCNAEFEVVGSLSETERGHRGFGKFDEQNKIC